MPPGQPLPTTLNPIKAIRNWVEAQEKRRESISELNRKIRLEQLQKQEAEEKAKEEARQKELEEIQKQSELKKKEISELVYNRRLSAVDFARDLFDSHSVVRGNSGIYAIGLSEVEIAKVISSIFEIIKYNFSNGIKNEYVSRFLVRIRQSPGRASPRARHDDLMGSKVQFIQEVCKLGDYRIDDVNQVLEWLSLSRVFKRYWNERDERENYYRMRGVLNYAPVGATAVILGLGLVRCIDDYRRVELLEIEPSLKD